MRARAHPVGARNGHRGDSADGQMGRCRRTTPRSIVTSIGATPAPETSSDAIASPERIAMKAIASRLIALALPIALFVAAAAPYLRF